MIAHLTLLTFVLVSLLKSRGRLEAEVLVLRHPLNVLRRAAPPRLRFTSMDQLIFVWLYRLCPSLGMRADADRESRHTLLQRFAGRFRCSAQVGRPCSVRCAQHTRESVVTKERLDT